MTKKQRRFGSRGVSGLCLFCCPRSSCQQKTSTGRNSFAFETTLSTTSHIQMMRIMEAKRPGKQLRRGTHSFLHSVFLWSRDDLKVSCDYSKWAHEWPWVSTLIGLGVVHDQLHISFWRQMARAIGQKIKSGGLWQRTGSHSSWRNCIPIIYWWREPSLDLSRLCFLSLIFGEVSWQELQSPIVILQGSSESGRMHSCSLMTGDQACLITRY